MNGSSVGMVLSIVYGITIAILKVTSVSDKVITIVALVGAGILGIFWTVGRTYLDRPRS
jgi:hypothetical protein